MIPQAYLYICDGDIDHPVLTHKKMDWSEKYPHWQEIPLVMAQKQEPFGYFQLDLRLDAWVQNRHSDKGVAFYTSPPQRTWVGMTHEEKEQFVVAYFASSWDRKTAVALMDNYEAYLKEKNA
jgi:hypothetical protein